MSDSVKSKPDNNGNTQQTIIRNPADWGIVHRKKIVGNSRYQQSV
jgi:hypothetical protein